MKTCKSPDTPPPRQTQVLMCNLGITNTDLARALPESVTATIVEVLFLAAPAEGFSDVTGID